MNTELIDWNVTERIATAQDQFLFPGEVTEGEVMVFDSQSGAFLYAHTA